MSAATLVVVYSIVVVLGALGGGLWPVFARELRLVLLLSFAAGVMFGAAFFHMLPEAFHSGGYTAFTLVPVGFLFLFLLERYVLVHACEEPPGCREHPHGSAMGLTAFFGLSMHTLFDGVALGSAAVEGVGFMAFVAIVAHKIPSSVSLASILKAEGRDARTILAYLALFGLMVPVGAALYFGLSRLVRFEHFAAQALAFSAGTFLYIAVSDLLPRVNRHGPEGRLGNILAMAFGLLVMFALTFATGHPH